MRALVDNTYYTNTTSLTHPTWDEFVTQHAIIYNKLLLMTLHISITPQPPN